MYGPPPHSSGTVAPPSSRALRPNSVSSGFPSSFSSQVRPCGPAAPMVWLLLAYTPAGEYSQSTNAAARCGSSAVEPIAKTWAAPAAGAP